MNHLLTLMSLHCKPVGLYFLPGAQTEIFRMTGSVTIHFRCMEKDAMKVNGD